MDAYLRDHALEDEEAGLTRTHIISDRKGELIAYVSILCDSIRVAKNERIKEHHSSVPALKIGLMGVRLDIKGQRFKGRTLGCWIIDWVVGLAVDTISTHAGLRYVTLDSLPEAELANWYAKYGFIPNEGEKLLRQTWRRAGSSKLKKYRPEEIDLPHISMRFDVRLNPKR